MATGVMGQRVSTLASVDSGMVVTATISNRNGTSHNWGPNEEPLPKTCVVQIGITNLASSDGYDLDVRVQFSEDDTKWPDAGEGQSLGNFFSAVAGDDLTRSRMLVVPVLARYQRLQYDNNNSSDNVTVSAAFARRNDSYAARSIA